MELLGNIDAYVREMTRDIPCQIELSKASFSSIIKSLGIIVVDDSTSLAEKLFITVNFRSYVDDKDLSLFFESIKNHQINLLMIENCERELIPYEKRHIVDKDFCVIK